MIQLRVDSHTLVLFDEDIGIELVNTLFTEGIEDSFSVPFSLPVKGNEKVLLNVAELALADRTITFEDAALVYYGTQVHGGALNVLGSDDTTLNASFSVEAFYSQIKGVRLPDLLRHITIDRIQEYIDTGVDFLINRRRYHQGGNYHFPQHFNPSLYGDANPDWYPSSVQDYNSSQAYQFNDLVKFTELVPLERTYIWQCISESGAPPGQDPVTSPVRWRRMAYGIVNAWNETFGTLHYNGPTGNFYAHVPWFYLKWVLKEAMAKLGYRVEGRFMEDPAYHEILVPNSTTVDVPSVRNDLYYFKASSTSSVTKGDLPWQEFALPGHDDSTPPNQDSSGMWSTDDFHFTCPVAGVWRFRAFVHFNLVRSRNVRFYLIREDGVIKSTSLGFLYRDDASLERMLTATMAAGDVGMKFRVVATQYHSGNIHFPIAPDDTYLSASVAGWLEEEAPTVCSPDELIYPHRHVPDVELSTWLNAYADALNLELQPDTSAKVLRIIPKDYTVDDATSVPVDESPRCASPIALDHQQRISGYRLHFSLDDLVPSSITIAEDLPEVYCEADLMPPISLGQQCLTRSTRKLLKSVFKNGQFHWRSEGYYVPDHVIGSALNAVQVDPDAIPLHMEEHYILGRKYLMPILDEKGTSAFFQTEGDRNGIYICEYHPGSSYDNDQTNIPSARSWGYGWSSSDHSTLSFVWDQDDPIVPGLSQRFHIRWCTMMTRAEPVVADMRVDPPFILDRRWCKPFLIDSQRYLIVSMPVSYGGHHTQLIATGTRMLRIIP